MEIRVATENDIPEILDLYTIFFSETAALASDYFKPAEQDLYFIKGMLESEDNDILLAVEDNRLKGFVLIQEMNTPPYSCFVRHRYATLTDIAVQPEDRNKGIGTKLIDAAKEWATKRNLDYIELNVLSNNTQAIRLYNKTGFSESIINMKMKLKD